MVIECKHVWDHISGYLDGTLSAEVLEQVQTHLQHCEICSAILDSTRNILILTADERVFELPLGFSDRLHARLEAEIRGIASAQSSSEEKDSMEKKAGLKEPDEPSGE
jgi:predicted anti-sigma-YlaC factor YlaD